MEKITLKVEGMSCKHCEQSVKSNIADLQGVNSVVVALATGEVQVDFDPGKITPHSIEEEIEDIGYDVVK